MTCTRPALRYHGGKKRVERAAHADGARDRIEVLWLNPAAERAIGQSSLFDVERAA